MSVLDEKKMDQLVKKLQRKTGITIEQIQETFACSRRTAYRWLTELEDRGFAIFKMGSRPVSFHIES